MGKFLAYAIVMEIRRNSNTGATSENPNALSYFPTSRREGSVGKEDTAPSNTAGRQVLQSTATRPDTVGLR